jgi:hypothetical protein
MSLYMNWEKVRSGEIIEIESLVGGRRATGHKGRGTLQQARYELKIVEVSA